MNRQKKGTEHDSSGQHPLAAARSLLIVEDDVDSCEMLLLVIRKRFPALAIHCARNGRVGWDLFQKHAPQVVISDLNMPEMDGLQMAQMIRTLAPGTKLIALSAHSERAALDVFGSEALIFDSFIAKPYKFSTLLAQLTVNEPQAP